MDDNIPISQSPSPNPVADSHGAQESEVCLTETAGQSGSWRTLLNSFSYRASPSKGDKEASSHASRLLKSARQVGYTLCLNCFTVDRTGKIRAYLLDILVIALLGLIVVKLWNECHNNNIQINPVSIPAALQAQGFDPQTCAGEMIATLEEIKEDSKTQLDSADASNAEESGLPDIELPEGKLSFEALWTSMGWHPEKLSAHLIKNGSYIQCELLDEPSSSSSMPPKIYMSQKIDTSKRGISDHSYAIQLWNSVILQALSRDHPYMTASYYYENGDYKDCVTALKMCLVRSNAEDRSRVFNLWALVTIKQSDAFTKNNQAALADAYARLHDAIVEDQEYRESLPLWNPARRDPYSQPYYNRGWMLAEEAEHLEPKGLENQAEAKYRFALENFERAYLYDSTSNELLGKEAFCMYKIGWLRRSAESYRRVIAVEPAVAAWHELLGDDLYALATSGRKMTAFERSKLTGEAASQYQISIGLNDGASQKDQASNYVPSALYGLGNIGFRTGNYSEAMTEYKQALELAPADNDYAVLRAEIARGYTAAVSANSKLFTAKTNRASKRS